METFTAITIGMCDLYFTYICQDCMESHAATYSVTLTPRSARVKRKMANIDMINIDRELSAWFIHRRIGI